MDYRFLDEYYKTVMTKSLAEEIKDWRVVNGHTYEMIHKLYQEKYVDMSKWSVSEQITKSFGIVPMGVSYEGMLLCDNAKKYLNDSEWS